MLAPGGFRGGCAVRWQHRRCYDVLHEVESAQCPALHVPCWPCSSRLEPDLEQAGPVSYSTVLLSARPTGSTTSIQSRCRVCAVTPQPAVRQHCECSIASSPVLRCISVCLGLPRSAQCVVDPAYWVECKSDRCHPLHPHAVCILAPSPTTMYPPELILLMIFYYPPSLVYSRSRIPPSSRCTLTCALSLLKYPHTAYALYELVRLRILPRPEPRPT